MYSQEENAFVVRQMESSEAKAVAELHRNGIPTGLLADLGTDLLSSLYQEIARSEHGFVYVLIDQCQKIRGFIAGATQLNNIMKIFVARRLFQLAFVSIKLLLSKATIVQIRDNVSYSSKRNIGVTSAELLSIVVNPSLKGTVAAEILLKTLIGEFCRRNVSAFKVMVRADFYRANAFYRKNGFEHLQTIKKGGHLANIYVYEVLPNALELISE